VNVQATLTRLIHGAQQGDSEAADALFAATYADLRRLARARLRTIRRPTLLDTGSLVHESFLRFAQGHNRWLDSREHFMRWAAQVMRSVIVDYARRRLAARRGGGGEHVTLDDYAASTPSAEAEILGVHEALERMASVEPRVTQLVEMRYFGGMTEAEIAHALGITERTVRRDWLKARLLLREALAA
jgi:RNA polymerase sigma factor (TIGR02999 family)